MKTTPLRTLLGLLLAALPAAASDGVVAQRIEPAAALEWTAERVLSARPMPLPAAGSLEMDEPIEPQALRRGGSVDRAGRAPSVLPPAELGRVLADPRQLRGRRVRAGRGRPTTGVQKLDLEVQPLDRGRASLDFSSSRLVPEDARFAYPYSAVGRLFFSIPGQGNFVCSASVISARVVLTAGHCVYEDGDFFEDFLFVPAYHQGEAPFGVWEANFVATTQVWADGGGLVPNEQDVGVLVMNDQSGLRIGEVTGWLGYVTGKLTPNHVKMLGYPGNHDSGERMHQTDSSSSECCFDNNAIYGSDMEGGASGGPWVQNFGTKARGQRGGKNRKENRVVAVTSCGPVDGREKFLCASELNGQGKAAINEACADAGGNCQGKGRPKN